MYLAKYLTERVQLLQVPEEAGNCESIIEIF